MAPTSNNSVRRSVLRVTALAAGVALTVWVVQFAVILPAAADTQAEEGSVVLTSTESTQQVTLNQFDPAAGTLEQVRVTVAVDGAAQVTVTNLTGATKTTSVTLETSASAAGPGVSGLEAAAVDSASADLAAGAQSAFGLDASAEVEQVLTDTADLVGFVGTGTVTFDVTGMFGVDVEGPATWRSTGSVDAAATVTVEYEFTPVGAATAEDDVATVAEDAPATTVDVLANDTDPDGDPISIESVVQPDNGLVVVTNGGADLTYQPNPDYCNDPPGGSPDTFAYTINGGSEATVSVTVTCVDDPPVAEDDEATVEEDAPATTVDVLANDIDPDGDPITIASATQPVNGTVVVSAAGDELTYEPDPDYCNDPPGDTPDTFAYTINGGSEATVSVTVTCVDDPPVAEDDEATVDEDAPATTVDVLANDTDPDGGSIAIASATQPANGTVVVSARRRRTLL